ncbi:MAG: Lsr2 family protein [Pseudonocardiaceae bacterium]|nr:MAG: Lsr2 family protein [Pseudonocardiaceae bacterium]
MASVTEVRLVDDLDGSVAVETIELALDGRGYELDLNEAHATELRDALAPYVAAARRAGRATSAPARRASSARSREETAEIRAWARENGFRVSDRGRVPSEVLEAFENRHSRPAVPEPGPDESAEQKPKRGRRKAKPEGESEAVSASAVG